MTAVSVLIWCGKCCSRTHHSSSISAKFGIPPKMVFKRGKIPCCSMGCLSVKTFLCLSEASLSWRRACSANGDAMELGSELVYPWQILSTIRFETGMLPLRNKWKALRRHQHISVVLTQTQKRLYLELQLYLWNCYCHEGGLTFRKNFSGCR